MVGLVGTAPFGTGLGIGASTGEMVGDTRTGSSVSEEGVISVDEGGEV